MRNRVYNLLKYIYNVKNCNLLIDNIPNGIFLVLPKYKFVYLEWCGDNIFFFFYNIVYEIISFWEHETSPPYIVYAIYYIQTQSQRERLV